LGELKLEHEKLLRHTRAHTDRIHSLEERVHKLEEENRRLRSRAARNLAVHDCAPAAPIADDGNAALQPPDPSEPDFASPLRELRRQAVAPSR
jgi:hypothetical protein